MLSMFRTLPRALARVQSVHLAGSTSYNAISRRTLYQTPRLAFPDSTTTIETTKATKPSKSDTKPKSKPTITFEKPAKGAVKKKTVKKPVKAKKPKRKAKLTSKRMKITPEMRPPTRPPGSFVLFFNERLNQQAERPKSVQETNQLAKDTAEQWKNLTFSERSVYQQMSQELRAEWRIRRDEYRSTADRSVIREINARFAKGRLSKGLPVRRKIKLPLPTLAGAPKRPLSGFLRFNVKCLQEPLDLPAREKVRRSGQLWRAMSESEKEVYNAPARIEMDAWKKAKTAFIDAETKVRAEAE